MKRDNRRGRQSPEQLRNAASDAIAFLRAMVKLVDARGWREVHFEFANCVLCTADTILTSDPEWQGERARLDSQGHISEMFEVFERVPVTVFKAIIELVERELRKDLAEVLERTSAARLAA